jgi:hypothetical protein
LVLCKDVGAERAVFVDIRLSCLIEKRKRKRRSEKSEELGAQGRSSHG